MQVKEVLLKSGYIRVWVVFAVIFTAFPTMAIASSVSYALKQASKGDWTQAQAIMNRSSDMAAKETVNWYAYSKGVSNKSFQEMANFIDTHQDWPYMDQIQRHAEDRIGGQSAGLLIGFFDRHEPLTGKGMESYLQALSQQGQTTKLQKIINAWWPAANLSRDDQRSLYQGYGRYIKTASHKARLNYLLDKGWYDSASGIAGVLEGGYPALVRAREALRQQSRNASSSLNTVPRSLIDDEGLLFDRLQWRRRKDLNQGAIEILAKAPPANQMQNPAAWWKERHIIVRRLIEEKKYQQAYRLASAHKQTEGFPLLQAEWVSGWLALEFVNEPWKAFEHFEKLYKSAETPISKARGAYWAGRASEKLDHREIAVEWYQVAARYPEVFYGQLAAEKSGVKRHINFSNNIKPVLPPQYKHQEQAAIWMNEAGLKNEADAFLLRLSMEVQTPNAYKYLATLAERMGKDYMAIKIAQSLQKEKDVTLYDVLYPNRAPDLKNVTNVEWAFAHAIMRQESRFDQNAISHAGARGLMQLMPATAQEVASRRGITHQTGWLTAKPAHNITLGSTYLRQMLDRFGGNYAMAAAAYNAGPGRVDRWIKEFGDPRRGQVDLINWIEQIPIYETRNYVQRVLEGVDVYRDRLKGQQPSVRTTIHVAAK